MGALPIVSRHHRNRRFYSTGNGVNYLIHDFPSAELGLKLGGFMVLLDGVGQNARPRRVLEITENASFCKECFEWLGTL